MGQGLGARGGEWGEPVPEVIARDCHTCAKPMDPVMAALGIFNHPGCDPVPQDIELTSPPAEMVPLPTFMPVDPKVGVCPLPEVAKAVKDELTTMIIWAEASRERSLQVKLGPSELGTSCDRQLAYRIMGLQGPNLDMADPWAGFVGSSIHHRTEESIRRYQAAHPNAPVWNIEEEVKIVPGLIEGHADLNRGNILVDEKSAGRTVMAEVRKNGPSVKYKVQLMLYAYGLRLQGRPIDTVALAFVPREGYLRDMFVWAAPYDEAMALEYLARPYRLRDDLVRLQVQQHPENWAKIPAEPSYMGCQYCPMWERYAGAGWDRHASAGAGATDKSCPGYQSKK